MILKKPQMLESLGISEKKPNYKWNSWIALGYIADDFFDEIPDRLKDIGIESSELRNKINQLPLNTQYAIGLAITEWIFWRFEKLQDITDEIERVESAWAGLININYIKSLEYEMKEDDDKEPIKGAIEVAKDFLNDLYLYYKDPEDHKYLASIVVRQLLLARHLMFNKKEFLSWFEEVMERVATISAPKEQILWRNELFMQSCDEPETKTDNEFLNALIKTDNKYINQDPHNPEKETVEALNKKSLIEIFHKKNYQKALEYTQLALESDNTNIEALYNQVYCLSMLNKIEEALICNEQLLQVNPTHYKALVAKGNMLFYQKKYKEAIEAYKILTEIKPDDIAGWQGMGVCYSWLGDYEKAIFYNKKAVEIDPDNSANYTILSNLGSHLNNLGQYEEALLYLNQSIAINDEYYHPYYCKACIFSKTNRLEEAISMIKKVLELDPSEFELLKNETDFKNIRNSEAFKQIFNKKTNK